MMSSEDERPKKSRKGDARLRRVVCRVLIALSFKPRQEKNKEASNTNSTNRQGSVRVAKEKAARTFSNNTVCTTLEQVDQEDVDSMAQMVRT